MAQQPDLYDETPDPQDVANAGQQADQVAVQRANDPFSRSMAVANQGFNQSANQLGTVTGNPNVGTPQVVQARRVSSVMKEIMQGASQLPDDTDPMDKNLYVANQVAKRMWDVSPQLAGKAMEQAQQIEVAKTEQAKLAAQTSQEQMKTRGMQQAQKISDITNRNAVLVDNGGNIVWSHPINDPNFDDALAKARQDNPNSSLTSESDFNKNDIRQRVAEIAAQAKVDAANARAAAAGEKMSPEDRQALQQVRKLTPGLVAIGNSGAQIADILTSAPDAMTIGAHVSSKLDNVFQSIIGSLKASAVDPRNPNAVDDAMSANQDVVDKGLAAADKSMPGWQGNAALHTAAMQMAFALAQGNVNGRITNYEVQQSIKMLNLAASGDKRQALTSLNTILAQKQATASDFVDAIGAREVKGVPEMLEYSSSKIKAAQDKINLMLQQGGAAPIGNIGDKPDGTTSSTTKPMPDQRTLEAYANKYFKGDTGKAAAFLASQGHK